MPRVETYFEREEQRLYPRQYAHLFLSISSSMRAIISLSLLARPARRQSWDMFSERHPNDD